MTILRPEVTGRKRPARGSKKPLSDRLVYTIPEAGRLLGLGRNAAYEAAKRGDIPTIRMGRLLLVPKIPLHKLVGADALRSFKSGGVDLSAAEDTEEALEGGER
jgi:excisionase family DNA binding protein